MENVNENRIEEKTEKVVVFKFSYNQTDSTYYAINEYVEAIELSFVDISEILIKVARKFIEKYNKNPNLGIRDGKDNSKIVTCPNCIKHIIKPWIEQELKSQNSSLEQLR